jgi:hypothetical protein
MTGNPSTKRAEGRWLIAAAAAILLITMGIRQTAGLFVLPMTKSTELSIVSLSFALAIGQFVWGAAQALFGAAADKFGPARRQAASRF